MKKIIIALMVFVGIASAEVITGVEVGTGKAYSSSHARVNTGVLKVGTENEASRLFLFIGADHYNNNEGSCKFYGIEFDKKFDDFYVGFELAFGKKNMKSYVDSVRDAGFKIGHTWYSEGSSIDAGVKFKDRLYKGDDTRDRLGLVFVGYNFNL